MRKYLTSICICPNSKASGFQAHALELMRDNKPVYDVQHDEIRETDDIKTGILITEDGYFVYPITDFVLSLLSDNDADRNEYLPFFKSILNRVPDQYKTVVENNIQRLSDRESDEVAKWNQEEMEYYDKGVGSDDQRRQMVENIKNSPTWHILLERKKHGVDFLNLNHGEDFVLEVGSGNSRTVYSIFHPAANSYKYIGSDISFKRLITAKLVLPEGDFVQCSAMNLPFLDNTFSAVISFSALHHLPDPLTGARQALAKLHNGGYFLFHEPINRPPLISSSNGIIKRVFQTYEHSIHDNSINVQSFLNLLDENNYKTDHVYYSGSLLRTVLARILVAAPTLNRKRSVWQLLIGLDQIFNKIFFRRINRFCPKAIMATAHKVG